MLSRSYAFSRNPNQGTSRLARPKSSTISRPPKPPIQIKPASKDTVDKNALLLASNPDSGGLTKLLANDALVVVRQIEMLNLFMGFEVANRYAINDVEGNVLGYIAEQGQGFFGTFARQAFRTHRAFRSVIMDVNGTPILWIHRPFSFINSRLYVQRKLATLEDKDDTEDDHASRVNLGEAKQEWHPWRRRYHLFLGQPEGDFHQFAQIDSGLWAWDFFLQNEADKNLASIRKGFTGFGREIFTDTSQYTIRFKPDPEAPTNEVTANGPILPTTKPLSLEERALVLALSVGIDFDYFSRHSEGGGGWGLPFLWIFSSIE